MWQACPVTTQTQARDPGLSAAEVADRIAQGQLNHLPPRSGRTVADIVRANVFTRINAILGVLLAIVLSTGSLINGLFGLLIVANSAIGGRTVIGDDSWVGLGANVTNGIVMGNHTRANIGSVVTKDVPDGASMSGNFAIDHKRFLENLKKSIE